MKQILAHVCGIPVSSSSVAYPNRLFLVPASGQYRIPPSNGPLKLKQYKVDRMNKLGGKADNLANGIREHRNTKFGHPSKEEEKRKILHKPEISDPGSHYGVRDCICTFRKNQFVHSNCILMMYLTCHGPSLRKPDEFGTPFSNVTCIQFNPVDDRYFINGSLDAKVHIWSIPDRQVIDWNDLHEMVTAACYTPDGQGALVGSYKGS